MLLHINRVQYSINVTFICTGKPKTSCDLLYSDMHFIVVVQNQTCTLSEVCMNCDNKYITGISKKQHMLCDEGSMGLPWCAGCFVYSIPLRHQDN